MDYNQDMIGALLGMSAMLYGLMEALIKPGLSSAYDKAVAKYGAGWSDDEKDALKYGIYRGVAVLLGIIFVAGNDAGMLSIMKVWWYKIPENWGTIDIIATGAVIGLGDRAIHWLVDFGEGSGQALFAWIGAKLNHEID